MLPFLRTSQALIFPALVCCLLVFSDLVTTKYQKKISDLRRERRSEEAETGVWRVAVIDVQQNNFFPCCTVRDHVRLRQPSLSVINIRYERNNISPWSVSLCYGGV